MPPPTCLAQSGKREIVGQAHAVAPKDPSLKMYHVMSVKQTLREDLAECAYHCISSLVELLTGPGPICMLFRGSLNLWNYM